MATQTNKEIKYPKLRQKKEPYHSLGEVENFVNAKQIDESKIILELQKGQFSKEEAWFVKDEENYEFVMIPQALLKNIIHTIRKAKEDKLLVELERDIISQVPVDFDDVMAVAIDKLESSRKNDGSLPEINTQIFVHQIKKEHPNLFLNFENYFQKQNPLT